MKRILICVAAGLVSFLAVFVPGYILLVPSPEDVAADLARQVSEGGAAPEGAMAPDAGMEPVPDPGMAPVPDPGMAPDPGAMPMPDDPGMTPPVVENPGPPPQ